jgi:hypothetical protein
LVELNRPWDGLLQPANWTIHGLQEPAMGAIRVNQVPLTHE